MYYVPVRQLIVALGRLDELPAVVEHSGIAHLVVDLQLLVPRLGLQKGGPVDEGLCLDGVVVLQVQSGYLQVGFELVVDGVLPGKRRVLKKVSMAAAST